MTQRLKILTDISEVENSIFIKPLEIKYISLEVENCIYINNFQPLMFFFFAMQKLTTTDVRYFAPSLCFRYLRFRPLAFSGKYAMLRS